ncbi:peptidylprolyl isomerase [Verrucomicrobiota bacterium sgz303538]
MARPLYSSLEPLEARIAPAALAATSVLPDLIAGIGKTGATVDLGNMFVESGYHTQVEFMTNFDTDPNTPGLQAGKIVIELFDDKAPVTVENFLKYVNSKIAAGDYNNTFFHRLAFTETNAPFVLQGGAFDTSNVQAHIPTLGEVHNEFDPTDTERSNTRGTIAMAKTGLGPNTATSEFFFNLGDNSQNLDSQNGGFTVFGKVTQGMDVIDKIAALPRYDLSNAFGNGALGEVPLQNYDPDPDHNAQTPSPLPGANNVVTITGAKVLPAKNGSQPGVDYSFSITDLAGQPTKLVTGKLNGDALQLAYKPGAAGQVKVSVTASNGTDTHTDDFVVNVLPNLVATTTSDTLPDMLVAGNSGKAKVTLSNTLGGAATGKVDVKFFLSQVTESDPYGINLDPTDVQVGAILGKSINLGGGKSTTLTSKVSVPQSLSLQDAGSYRLIAQVTSSDGSTLTELFTDDNIGAPNRVHGYFNSTSANLAAVAADDTLANVVVPGEHGTGKVLVVNNSGQLAKGKVDVTFFLSHVDNHTSAVLNSGADPYGTTLDATDVQIGSIVGKNVTIPAGKSLVLSGAIQIPPELMQIQGDVYRVVAVVTPSTGSTLTEMFAGDNLTYDNSVHGIFNAFGSFGVADPNGGDTVVRKNVTITYKDSADHLVQMSLSGRGHGILGVDATGVDLVTEDTSAKSVLTAKTLSGERTTLRTVGTQDTQSLGTVSMGSVDVTGEVYFRGGVKNLTLGNLGGTGTTHQMYIGAFASAPQLKANVHLGSVTDYKMFSDMPINALTVTEWKDHNTDAEGVLLAALTSFSSQGNFEANMFVQGATRVESFTVGGAMAGSRVDIVGDVASVKLGAMTDSALFVGSNGQGQFRADALIGKFTIQGASNAPDLMANSEVRVARIGTANIQSVDADSTGAFGITALAIQSYNRGTVHLTNLVGPGNGSATTVDQVGNYSVQLV